MIYDHLENASVYRRLGERFAVGFDYLRSANFAATPDGKYEIVGQDVFAIVQTYETKPAAQGRWEAHRVYADIQFVVSGMELMRYGPLNMMKSNVPYDATKDLEFFDGGSGQPLFVEAGEFAVFFPHDVHMPSLSIGAGDGPWDRNREIVKTVKKCVIKVRV